MIIKPFLFALGLGAVALCLASEPAPLIPIADLFRNPELTKMELSPDGNYVAYLASYNQRLNLYVRRLGSTESTRLTNAKDRDIGGFQWMGDHRLVYSIDDGGKENWRIHAIDRDGANPQLLTPQSGVQARLISKLRGHPDHLLITLNQRDPRSPDLYKINAKTGEADLLVKNDRRFVRYVADNAGVIRLALATDGVNVTLFHRATDEASFEHILTTDFRASVGPLFFTADNRQFYALSNRDRDKAAIVVIDPKNGGETEVIFEHPQYDAGGLMREGDDLRITGAHYIGDKLERVYFDERWRQRYRDVEGRLPGLAVEIVSADRARRNFLVKAWSDRDPGTYYHYQEEAKELTKIGAVAPWIDGKHFASIKPISYQSRDGLTIHGYLTVPNEAVQGPLPTLIVVHGGPWARVQWRADPEIQFFANRGYAVLQMNYRGSRGYGRAFLEAGFKQWGRAMQDDITDGVRWLVDQKIADPKRIGIYGVSYGGYATLAGLAFTPELYRCGIDDCGVSDIADWLDALPPAAQAAKAMLHAMVGNPETERTALDAVSPLKHADRIKAPLLLVHGTNDPRVSRSHSDKIAAALTAHGVEVEYLTKSNEGHSFHLEENKMEFYRRAEQFLAKHLGGRVDQRTVAQLANP